MGGSLLIQKFHSISIIRKCFSNTLEMISLGHELGVIRKYKIMFPESILIVSLNSPKNSTILAYFAFWNLKTWRSLLLCVRVMSNDLKGKR